MTTPVNAPAVKSDKARPAANSAPRYVISWFGVDIRDFELISEEEFRDWMVRMAQLVRSMGFRVERLANNIDMIVGKESGSVTRREFFAFQRAFEAFNEELGFRMSGILHLMDDNNQTAPTGIWEHYSLGRKVSGDSIGRPSRHSLRVIRARKRNNA